MIVLGDKQVTLEASSTNDYADCGCDQCRVAIKFFFVRFKCDKKPNPS